MPDSSAICSAFVVHIRSVSADFVPTRTSALAQSTSQGSPSGQPRSVHAQSGAEFSNARIEGERAYRLASVLYDACNGVAVAATLARADAYEVDLAVAHLAHARPGDLILADRNNPSFRMLAEFTQRGIDFAVRCSAASFKVARAMLRGQEPDSQIVTLTPCAGQRAAIRRRGLQTALKVRFVRVRLSTGEYEVLVTSLLDEARWPTADFHQLYHLRWGAETFYGVLKTRLTLENFTGIGPEAKRPGLLCQRLPRRIGVLARRRGANRT